MKKYENSAKPITEGWMGDELRDNEYGYDAPSDYMRLWSRALQAVVSQAASKLLSGEFNSHECGIYKAEGGCRVNGGGDLVLGENSCYFDRGYGAHRPETQRKQQKCAELITKIVLEWDPMDPVESMFRTAAEYIGLSYDEFKAGVEQSKCGGAFGGDALWTFFGPNRRFNMDDIRDYRRFCLISFDGKSEEDVDQAFADEDLGKQFKEQINAKIRKADPAGYLSALCCSPCRGKAGLRYWINTGRSTQIDGWKTEADIKAFLESDGKLVDTAAY